ncbi:MAG: lipoate--protein ligase family protein [Thermoprotei archaeon]|nr:lipoate--protein ligase family protein [Thermoprotei archaeon]
MEIVKYSHPSPPVNVALEEVLLERVRAGLRGDVVRIWVNPPSIVIGYSLKPCEEVRCGEAARMGVPVVRRVSGGGAVYHDYGNLNVSIIRSSPNMKRLDEVYGEATSIIVGALKLLGVEARVENGNDVVVSGYKVSGTAAALKGGGYLVHSTLLVASNMEVLKALIKPRLDRVLRGEVTGSKYNPGNLMDIAGVNLREALEALHSALEYAYGPLEESGVSRGEISEALSLAPLKLVPLEGALVE